MGQTQKGLERFERLLSIWELAEGPDSSDVALALSNLAATRISVGDFARAENELRRALSIREASGKLWGRRVARLFAHLARARAGQGDPEAAEDYFRRSVALADEILGQVSARPTRAAAFRGLAKIHVERGETVFSPEWPR